MSGRLPYGKRYKYPHMIGDDIEIWERFVDKYPGYFNTVDYDWRVGKGMSLDQTWDPKIKRMATMLTQKRIDVIGWKDDQPVIIEVKKRVGLSTLGQVLGYKTLFINEFPKIKTPELMIITEIIGADDLMILKIFDIPVEIV